MKLTLLYDNARTELWSNAEIVLFSIYAYFDIAMYYVYLLVSVDRIYSKITGSNRMPFSFKFLGSLWTTLIFD